MNDNSSTAPKPADWPISTLFEEQRPRLRSIAFRMLGSHSDAEDAVQEAWLRLQRTDAETVRDLAGWLTTVVSRVCLDQLRARSTRREDVLDDLSTQPDGSATTDRPEPTPEDRSVEADAVGAALLVVLDTLGPTERLAFVLHDLFGLPYDEIAPIVGKSAQTARQLASRARHRVQGVEPSGERQRQRELVDAFLAASRKGDFGRLLRLLDPEVELRADPLVVAGAKAAAATGKPAPLLDERARGADAVSRIFVGRAVGAKPALINGVPGAVWAPDGTVLSAFAFTIQGGTILGVEVIGDPAVLRDLEVVLDEKLRPRSAAPATPSARSRA